MKKIAFLGMALVLTGCGSMSDVVRTGENTYMVSSGGGIYTQNPSGMRQEVYESANEYCKNLGKEMESVSTNEQPYALGRHTGSISLTFKCK